MTVERVGIARAMTCDPKVRIGIGFGWTTLVAAEMIVVFHRQADVAQRRDADRRRHRMISTEHGARRATRAAVEPRK